MSEKISTPPNSPTLALVTGASKRLGREIALNLARKGYSIGLHYFRSTFEAESTKREIEALGSRVVLLKADLRDPKAIVTLFEEIEETKIELGLLVNSAAIMPKSDLLTIAFEEWENVMNSNLRSVWLCSQQAVPLMKEGGLILNISDVGADQSWTQYGAYVISKAGVNTLTRILAKQLAPKIRVCGIAPGLLMRSPNMKNEEWDQLASKVPMKSAGDLSSFFATIDLLIENGYITGETIKLDGGSSLG
jgi:pteridine reductase